MKKITTIFLILLGFVSFVFTNLTVAAEEEMEGKYEQVLSYISNHLSEFRTEYNKTHAMERLNATSIEKHCLVYIIDSNEYGIYLDFNDDKGYLVTSFNYSLYTLNTTDDLTYLKDVEFTYYSAYDGFLYHNGDSFHKYNEEMDRDNATLFSYDGQGATGESDIYDLDAYVSNRYSSSYKVEESYITAETNKNFTSSTIKSLAYYVNYVSKDGGYTYSYSKSESNCAIATIFNVMDCWQKNSIYGNLPSKSTLRNMNYYIEEDPDYIYYGIGEETVGHDFYWTINDSNVLKKIPELYYQIRNYAATEAKYHPELGINTENTIKTMNHIMNEYKHSVTFTSSFNFSDVMSSLKNGRAVFMGLANSLAYEEDHAVTLLGYKRYSYKTGAWIFEKTHYAYFFLINDGYSSFSNYFDPNCNSKLVHEFIY